MAQPDGRQRDRDGRAHVCILAGVRAAEHATRQRIGGAESGFSAAAGRLRCRAVALLLQHRHGEDLNGDELPFHPSLSSDLFAAGFSYVTTKKVLGGYYGVQVLFPAGANNRIQGTEIDQNPGAGLTDSVFVPMQLGWHFKRADAVASYSIFAPTGRYENGASNNTGFGMWGQELASAPRSI